MLYRLSSREDIFDLNPGLKAIEEFHGMTSMQMMFVALVADTAHDNPLGSLPEKKRREKAAIVAGYKMSKGERQEPRLEKNGREMVYGKVTSVEKAIAKYREFQYDPDRAMLDAITNQISEITEILSTPKKGEMEDKIILSEKASKMGATLTKLWETQKELTERIKSKDPVKLDGLDTFTSADILSTEVENGGEPMSTIDQYMARK